MPKWLDGKMKPKRSIMVVGRLVQDSKRTSSSTALIVQLTQVRRTRGRDTESV